jgi:MutS domain I
MDAFVGVECLGLQFMKGDQPHAGFPEAAYFTMAEKLARAGHRVVVVEQVLRRLALIPQPPLSLLLHLFCRLVCWVCC